MRRTLGPGHGKLLVGAYLASSEGRARDAVGLGGLVALMHTGSVLVLALVFLLGQQLPSDARLEAGATMVAGALTTVVGAVTLRARWRGWRGNDAATVVVGTAHPTATHHLDTRTTEHDHDHAHGHGLPAGVSPLSRTGLVAIATAGGLVPSPAALLVLATAFALGRAGVGVALVAAFGLGLGATLTAIGLGVLWGRQRLDQAADRHTGAARVGRVVPVVAAGLVMLGGAVLVLLGALRW